MSSLQQIEIKNLTTDMKNITINGVVIARNQPKIFNAFKSGDFRGVSTFTIRDSTTSTINCVLWGSEAFLKQSSTEYPIGAAITMSYVKISLPINEKFLPNCSSPFIITLTEGKSQFGLFKGDASAIESLIYTPMKPISMALSLMDVKANGSQGCGEFVDVLVLVRDMKEIREIKMKNGQTKHLRELVVMDKTCPGMLITIWNQDIIDWSERWTNLQSVLFLADVKIEYSSFYKSACLGLSPKTVITENPKGGVRELMDFVQSRQLEEDWHPSASTELKLPSAEAITNIMSVGQVRDRLEGSGDAGRDDDRITALLYAVITKFDVDNIQKTVATKWLVYFVFCQ